MNAAMPVEGRVHITVTWDGQRVRDASVASQRPQPTPLLRGRPVTATLPCLPRLYQVCGEAQAVAVEALLLVQQHWPATGAPGATAEPRIHTEPAFPPQEWAERIRRETLREHVWRLGLDWPRLMGEPPQPMPLRTLMAARAMAVPPTPEGWRDWAAGVLRDWFAEAGTGVEAPFAAHACADWLAVATTPLARLLRRIRHECQALEAQETQDPDPGPGPDAPGSGACRAPVLPGSLVPKMADLWPVVRSDPEFALRPHWHGQCLEMGPWARQWDGGRVLTGAAVGHGADLPRMAEGERPRDGSTWSRVVARVLELHAGLQAMCAETPAVLPLVVYSEGTALQGECLVGLEMARGTLIHWLRVEQGRIADYRIVAPTEWNFHPQGPAWRGLCGVHATTEADLRRRCQCVIMALDPCVQYTLEIQHA
jgi:hypothetical protein